MSSANAVQRPTLLSVVSVIGMGFGALGVLVTPFSLLVYFVDLRVPNPVAELVRSDSFLFAWTIGSTVIGVVLSLMLLAGSFLAYRLRPVGRKLLIAYGVAGLVTAGAAMLVNGLVLMPRLLDAAKGSNPSASAGALGGAIGSSIGGLMGMLFPIVMLVIMSLADVKRAFGANQSALPEID